MLLLLLLKNKTIKKNRYIIKKIKKKDRMIQLWSYSFIVCDILYSLLYIYTFLIGKINVWILVSYVGVIAAMWVPMWDYLVKELGEDPYIRDKKWNHGHESTMLITISIKVVSYLILIIAIGVKAPIEFINIEPSIVWVLGVMAVLMTVCLFDSMMIYRYHFKLTESFLEQDASILSGMIDAEMIPDDKSILSVEVFTDEWHRTRL